MVAVLRKRPPSELMSMIKVLLQNDIVIAVGDDTKMTGSLSMGVPEGTPLSPTLFNIYMDTLAVDLLRLPKRISRWPSKLYPDNVKLMARNKLILQQQLDVCNKWAREHYLYWAPSKRVALTPSMQDKTLFLEGKPLKRVERAIYLGASIACYGIERESTITRLKAAR